MGTVLVAGGTGTLGREVVRALTQAGHTPRIASRHPRPAAQDAPAEWSVVDYRTRAGLADALAGVDAAVLAVGGTRDTPAVRTVIDTAPAGLHLVYISIVGIDAIPMRYYSHKLDSERLLSESGLPWTVLRATQFHNLVATMMRGLAKFPAIMPVPKGVSVQPIAVGEVADRLAALAIGEPAGRVPDMGGPQARRIEDLARVYLQATGRRRRITSVALPGRIMRALAGGANLAPDHRDGVQTFEEFLATRP